MSTPVHLVCPHCATVNRIPAAKLELRPNCGECHRPLFSGQPLELDAAGFDRQLARNELPMLVDFWAPWCGPCRMMAPQFEQAARTLEPHVRLVKVNTEAEPGLAQRHGIRSIPTLALFHRGRERARQAGAMSAHDLVRWVRDALAPN